MLPPRARRTFRSLATVAGLSAAMMLSSGCDELLGLGDGAGMVHVYASHHGAPEDGSFPELGNDGEARVFHNDLGWRVTLIEGYVVSSHVELERCVGDVVGLELYYGQLAENMLEEDLETQSLGGADVTAGEYCNLVVEYGPYDMVAARAATTDTHTTPSTEMVDGATVYLQGVAEKDDQRVTFEFRSDEPLLVDVDLSTIRNGGPLKVKQDNAFPHELTVSKAYDRFFDGLDFSSYETEDMELAVIDALVEHTRASLGTRPKPD